MLTIDEIVKSTGGQLLNGTPDHPVSGVSIDSRTIKNGDIFVAIKGDVFDGHNYIEDAIRKGACGAIKKEGHLNNHIGVPLTFFRLISSHNMALIEMGISDRGELTRLCEIAAPTA